jgi:hypothetical protein
MMVGPSSLSAAFASFAPAALALQVSASKVMDLDEGMNLARRTVGIWCCVDPYVEFGSTSLFVVSQKVPKQGKDH